MLGVMVKEDVRLMTRSEVLEGLSRYFDVRELVCRHVWGRFGNGSWDFFDTDLLKALLWLRLLVGRPVYVNNWVSGGVYDERGLRCNMCGTVRGKGWCYMSMHIFGKAVDCTVDGMDAWSVRSLIMENADSLPCGIRLEDGVNWVHLDVRGGDSRSVPSVVLFTAS